MTTVLDAVSASVYGIALWSLVLLVVGAAATRHLSRSPQERARRRAERVLQRGRARSEKLAQAARTTR